VRDYEIIDDQAITGFDRWSMNTIELLPLTGSEYTHFTRHRKMLQSIISHAPILQGMFSA
jgi:hypothetical protein